MATKVINSLTFGDTYVFTTPYATSSTGASTQAKVATLTPNSNFSLETGVRVAVRFSAANTASSPTLNVNSSGAKTIQFRGAALTSSLYRWAANSVVEFMYDGTYWQMLGAPDNTNTDTNTNHYHTPSYTSTPSATTTGGSSNNIKVATGTGVADLYIPTATGSAAGVTIVYPAASCTTFTSDSGTCTPAAVKKAVGMFVTVTPSLTSGTKVGTITVNGTGHDLYCQTNTDTNTHYTTKLFATSSTGTAHAATTNGNTYLRLFDDSTARQSIKITGSGATSVTSNANGVITISSTDNNTNTSHSHSAGDGISLTGSGGTSGTTTIALAESGVTAGSYGPAAGEELFHSQDFFVPQLSVDKYGRVTSIATATYTLPAVVDTKVTQAADTTATTTLPVLLGYTSGTTATTQTVKKNSAQLNFTPGAAYGTLTVKGDIIAGGGSDDYGIHPATNNYSTLGKADKKWYKVYTSSIYVNNIYKADGSTFSFPATMTWNTF